MLQEQFPDMHPFVIYSYILEKRHEMAIEWFERNGLDSTSLKHHHLSWYMLKNIPAQNEIDSWLLYTLRDMANDDDEEEQSE